MLQQFSTDFVLVEGMKSEKIPKILCAKEMSEIEQLQNEYVFAISGIIANQCSQINTQPVFHYKRDIEKLADLVEEKALLL